MNPVLKTFVLTSFALIAFAANSVLCRLALGNQNIDAASFTVIRLISGAITLLLILKIRDGRARLKFTASRVATLMLFLYAVTFSFAYITLNTATGALILFGAVQMTMIIVTLKSGYRLHVAEWLGVVSAFAGFVYLVLPNVNTPSMSGFILMTVAGIAWGIYTLRGRGSTYPLGDTAHNFARTIPLVAVLALIAIPYVDLSVKGVVLAFLSGAVASGIGYSIWYTALGGLSSIQAAVVQLLVPVIAAAGGVVFVGEAVSLRLVISAIMILGGILIVVVGKYYFARAQA
jgi:drug/metabolite transporter (DMT)-like permease